MLSVKDLHVSYGAIRAVNGVSIEVPEGKIVALLGANGAGKTTMLRTICGLLRARAGQIEFEGERILGTPAYQIVQKGITMAPEGRRIFPSLSVLENLRVGAYVVNNESDIARNLESVFELFPVLKERVQQRAGLLSGGEQQMLAVGRALMSDPRLLIMDEPSLGLAPMLVRRLLEAARAIHERGKTILLAEQNARAALRLADYLYVLETGRVVAQGSAEELRDNDAIRKAYLGVV